MNPLNINIFYQIFPSSFSTYCSTSYSVRVHMYILSIWYMCEHTRLYIHEGKTNKKLNTRPNFKVKITYTIRPLVLYYWNTTRIGHCDRIKFYSDIQKNKTSESYGKRMRRTESASVLSPVSCIRNHYIHTVLHPWMGAWEHRNMNMNRIVPYSKQKGSISSPSHCDERKSGLFFIFFYIILFGLRYDFRQKIFCTIVCGGGNVVPLKSPFNLYNVMRSRCDFGFFTFVYASHYTYITRIAANNMDLLICVTWNMFLE